MRVQHEIEVKYDLPAGFDLPADPWWADVPGVDGAAGPERFDLDARYHDTTDRRLLRAKVTLRRREGGHDAGWHVKRPPAPGAGRREEHHPLGDGPEVPAEVAASTFAITRGAPLVEVVRLRTRRTVRTLLGAGAVPLVEIADDTVHATVAPVPPAQAAADAPAPVPVEVTWRELEVEWLGDPDESAWRDEVLGAVGEVLVEAGARPSPWPSKLVRAVRTAAPEVDLTPWPDVDAALGASGLATGTPAWYALRHLAEQVVELHRLDPAVRLDAPDAVHQGRVTLRRLRSALRAFAPLMRRRSGGAEVQTWIDLLRRELTWLSGVLGGARDLEVVRDDLLAMVELAVPGPTGGDAQGAAASGGAALVDVAAVTEHVAEHLGTRHAAATAAVREALGSARYATLLDDLELLLRADVWAPASRRASTTVLPGVLQASFARVRRRAVAAAALVDDPVRYEAALHDVRRAAKECRYVGEALAPAMGRPVRRLARRLRAVQECLGTLQDTVLVREALEVLAADGVRGAAGAFGYGRLHALQQARADAAVAAFAGAWAQAQDADRALG